ncbi:MAG: Eco29kI family restriction endonuclease [Proteobacteria bacterium]|nr:MAG: Eco29kI family restriction endonuclease [Pseudomonadota bacterium]
MHALYSFDFLDTISKQLQERLDSLNVTLLNGEQLGELENFQEENQRKQGVYVIHYDGAPRYIGKAANVAERLKQHYKKLTGRQNIDLAKIGYKCLLLDKSMSTAANEDLLIEKYREVHSDLWNGQGFGPKDPGKERDTTVPGSFDQRHPIRLDFQLSEIDDAETVKSLSKKLKTGLPYVFRYNVSSREEEDLNLVGIERVPRSLVQALVNHLGAGWRGAILSYGIVVYQNQKNYLYGETIDPI